MLDRVGQLAVVTHRGVRSRSQVRVLVIALFAVRLHRLPPLLAKQKQLIVLCAGQSRRCSKCWVKRVEASAAQW